MEPAEPKATITDGLEPVEIGSIAKAITDLKPSGKAQLGEHVFSVISTEAFIHEGATVEVVGFEMHEAKVKSAATDTRKPAATI